METVSMRTWDFLCFYWKYKNKTFWFIKILYTCYVYFIWSVFPHSCKVHHWEVKNLLNQQKILLTNTNKIYSENSNFPLNVKSSDQFAIYSFSNNKNFYIMAKNINLRKKNCLKNASSICKNIVSKILDTVFFYD